LLLISVVLAISTTITVSTTSRKLHWTAIFSIAFCIVRYSYGDTLLTLGESKSLGGVHRSFCILLGCVIDKRDLLFIFVSCYADFNESVKMLKNFLEIFPLSLVRKIANVEAYQWIEKF
jgi:hypothetical protein